MLPGLLLVNLLLNLTACKQPDLGLDVQDASDAILLNRFDSLVVRTTLEREDSVKSDELNLNLLGAYNDPQLGKIRAGIYAQFRPAVADVSLGEGPVIDSLVLVLPYRSAYGDLTKFNGLQKFAVYRVTEAMDLAASYYSNDTLQRESSVIGSTGYILPRISDSVTVGGVNSAPQLRILLSDALKQDFLDNQSQLVSAAAFTDYFKGVYISAETQDEDAGDGAILDFNLTAGARIDLFYHNSTDTSRTSFVVSESSPRFTRFNHAYSQEVLDLINTPALAQEKLYVQTMAGLRARLDFPNLLTWKDNRNILIHSALLVVSADQTLIGKYAPNPLLNIITKAEDGTLIQTADLLVGNQDYSGGVYNATTKEYRFNIARHLQRLINGTITDRGLFLQATGTGVSSNRVPLYGGSSVIKPLRLELLYQVLPN